MASAIPQTKIGNTHLARLNTLEQRFNSQLIGQPHAVAQVSELIQQIAAGFFDEKGPLGVLLFSGPTGVGKTEMAKMVAEELGCPFYRYNMSEFQNGHTLTRFLGSNHPLSEGEFISAMKRSPCSVILLHEIEKAHRDINRLFMQLFDEGHLTDSVGNVVSAKQSIFIMTTNLNSQLIYNESSQNLINDKIKAFFILRLSPEFVGRLHKIVVFNPLDGDSIVIIAQKYLVHLTSVIEKRKQIKITWSHQVVPLLLNDNSDFTMGVRGVHRKVRERLLKVLTDQVLNGSLQNGDSIHLSERVDGQIGITHIEKRTISLKPISNIQSWYQSILDNEESLQKAQLHSNAPKL